MYSGVVGGNYNSHKGSAASPLCPPMSSVPGGHGLLPVVAYLYVGVCETFSSSRDKEQVCSVCRSVAVVVFVFCCFFFSEVFYGRFDEPFPARAFF